MRVKPGLVEFTNCKELKLDKASDYVLYNVVLGLKIPRLEF